MISIFETISSILVAFLKLFTSCYANSSKNKKKPSKTGSKVKKHSSDQRGKDDHTPHQKHRRTSITETTSTTTTKEFVIVESSPSSDSPTHTSEGSDDQRVIKL